MHWWILYYTYVNNIHLLRSYYVRIWNLLQLILLFVWVLFVGREMTVAALECDAFSYFLWSSCSWRNNAGPIFHKTLAGHDSLLFQSAEEPWLSWDAKWNFAFPFSHAFLSVTYDDKKSTIKCERSFLRFYISIKTPVCHLTTNVLSTILYLSIFLHDLYESVAQ